MANLIHPTAVIGSGVEIAPDVRIGPYAVVEDHVRIGSGTQIGAHTVIHSYTCIGSDNRVSPHVVLGGEPQDLKFTGQETWLEIGDRNTIREFVTVHRSTTPDDRTVIGHDNFLMAYVHVAHNCKIGNHAILVNYVGLSGHVEIEDRAFLSGGALVHQFVRVGRNAMVGGGTKLSRDALPFCITDGNPPRLFNLNVVGLRRNGIPGPTRQAIQEAVRVIRRGGAREELAGRVVDSAPGVPEVAHLAEFVRRSRRGFVSRLRGEAGLEAPDEP